MEAITAVLEHFEYRMACSGHHGRCGARCMLSRVKFNSTWHCWHLDAVKPSIMFYCT